MSRLCEMLAPECFQGQEEKIWNEREERLGKTTSHMSGRKESAPKISTRSLTMRQYAAFLMATHSDVEVGRQRLYDWFREQGVIPKHSRVPSKEYLQNGLFEVRYADNLSHNRSEPVALITPEGQVFFSCKILKKFKKCRKKH